jgi:ecotin
VKQLSLIALHLFTCYQAEGVPIMVKKNLVGWAAFGLLAFFAVSGVWGQESKDNLKAYPAASEGMKRYVLHLKPRENEELFRIELQVGKTVELDEVNLYFFGGNLQEESVEGWGYSKFVLKEIGVMAGTLIGVAPDAPKVARFITLGGEPRLVRYNSRLPVVVYVPEGVDVRYRIWRTKADTTAINPG